MPLIVKSSGVYITMHSFMADSGSAQTELHSARAIPGRSALFLSCIVLFRSVFSALYLGCAYSEVLQF